jgi:ribonucleotide reductase alpha subunit
MLLTPICGRRFFYEMMIARYFLANNPTLMNAGTSLGQLSTCFIIPVENTMEGIFEAIKDMALVQCTGGGTRSSWFGRYADAKRLSFSPLRRRIVLPMPDFSFGSFCFS